MSESFGEINVNGFKYEVPFVTVTANGKKYSIPEQQAIIKSLIGEFRRSHPSYQGKDKLEPITDFDQAMYVLNRLASSCKDGETIVKLIDVGVVDSETFQQNWAAETELGK